MLLDILGPLMSTIGVIIASAIAYKGTKSTDATDRLSKAAGLYGDYAEKMERRVTELETKNLDLESKQDEVLDRLDISEKTAQKYKEETETYRVFLLDLAQWIKELVEWETNEFKDSPPSITLSVILSKLNDFTKSSEKKI